MSTLIIGALFVVALIALIALVVVVRSGPTSSKVQQSTDNERIVAATPVSTETPTVSTVPTVPTIQQEDTYQNVSSAVPEHHAYVLNGQFRELSIGLHALREQSQEMEQRLNSLTMMIEDVERSQKE